MALGAYQTNCYILWNEESDRCVVIDPGYEPERVLAEAARLGKNIEAVLLTHGHFDHVGGVRTLAAETDCRVYLHEKDLSMPPQMTAGPLYYTDLYREGDVLDLAGLKIRVIHTPGHTEGSVCLLVEDAMFSGDTLFEGSCGRTDLPGGDWATILKSLKRLTGMEKNYAVYPGHGPSTTLDDEKKWNPYMRQ
jgi:glyoxylase-like metal-dependent hydrolase (beta-lactamase superfamily II)